MDSSTNASSDAAQVGEVHHKIGHLTRQLHDALSELGIADRLRGTVGEIPDAKSRLTYIARLTGEAAEKVLNRVDQAKAEHERLSVETQSVRAAMLKDPVSAVASGQLFNFLNDVERIGREMDVHLTEIMMAQDFHDLTGQVIARVVSLAANIEEQLVQLLLQTAPASAPASIAEAKREGLQGPVVSPEGNTDVVTDQSQVDDLLASLGF